MTTATAATAGTSAYAAVADPSCSEACASCDSSMCHQCIAGYALISGACVPCPGNCASCTDPNTCDGCWEG